MQTLFVPIDNEEKNSLCSPPLPSASWITTQLTRACAGVCARARTGSSACAQDVFTALAFDAVIYILLDLLVEEAHARTKGTQICTSRAEGREMCSARKQVDDQTDLTEALWCLYSDHVLEICFTYLTLRELPLNSESEGWWIFQKFARSCHKNIQFIEILVSLRHITKQYFTSMALHYMRLFKFPTREAFPTWL